VLVQKSARESWDFFRKDWPMTHPAANHLLPWREIAPRPSDPAAAWAVLYGVVEQHVGRLKELLAENEAREAAEDPAWANRAALDYSPALAGQQRYQSTKRRELLRTLDTLCRMRKSEFGMRNEQAGTAQEECQMANDEGQSNGPLTEDYSGPIVGHDSDRVIDDSTNDKNGILSHEGEHAAGQAEQGDSAGQCLVESKIENRESKISVCQGDGLEQTLDCGVKTPQKAPNEAKLESTQTDVSQGVESENADPLKRERSHL